MSAGEFFAASGQYASVGYERFDRRGFLFGFMEMEKAIFVLFNLLDIAMTFLLLQTGAFYESNPIANYVMNGWGFIGMVVFKLTMVAFVMMLANIIATKSTRSAKFLLWVGTAIVMGVVFYSTYLLFSFESLVASGTYY